MENEIGWLLGLPVHEVIRLVIIAVIVYFAARLGQRAIDKNELVECAILGGVLLLTLTVGMSHFLGMDEAFPAHRDTDPFLFHALAFLAGVGGVCFFAVIHKYSKYRKSDEYIEYLKSRDGKTK